MISWIIPKYNEKAWRDGKSGKVQIKDEKFYFFQM